MKTVLITGVLGQDGTYLAEHLLGLGYRVFGTCRRGYLTSSHVADWALNRAWNDSLHFLYCDVRDELSIRSAIKKSWPDEIYNLAGQVYVPLSWEMPETTFAVNVGGLATILKVVEQVKRDTKVYQASSSEMFGNHEGTCTDETPMYPTSPYGVSKFAAHRLVSLYRSRDIFACAGILFNHESPRRGQEMVTRKIARHVAEWANGSKSPLYLGNLSSRRDWGFAGDYVKAMHLMLQHSEPDDYVVGLGESHSVRDFIEAAIAEVGISKDFANEHTKVDPRFVRTQEIFDMRADNSKVIKTLGWKPTVNFQELVRMMLHSELSRLQKEEEVKA